MEITTVFDYAQLDTSTRIIVQQEDKEFDRNMGEANGSFLYACKNLQRIQEVLRYKRPGFAEYCNNKPGLSNSTAYRMLNVAKMFPDSGNIPIQSREAIYLLADPLIPEEARKEVMDRAEAGETFTYKKAKGILKTGGIPKTTIKPKIADTGIRVESQINRSAPLVDSQELETPPAHCLELACDENTWRTIKRTFNDPVWAGQVLAAAANLSESELAEALGIERQYSWD